MNYLSVRWVELNILVYYLTILSCFTYNNEVITVQLTERSLPSPWDLSPNPAFLYSFTST